MKAASPLLVGRALPTQETAVVRLTGINTRGLLRCLRLGLSLHGRAALVVLKCPIPVRPFLVGHAQAINEAAVVDISGRLRLRCHRWLILNALVAHPICHPIFVSVAVDLQPAVELADDSQSGAGWCRFDDAGLEAGARPQIGIEGDADGIVLRGNYTGQNHDG